MTNILVVEELHDTRRRLSEQCGRDVEHYAAMLQEVAQAMPGVYVQQPILSLPTSLPKEHG